MIVVKKKMKKSLLISILAAVLVVLTVAAILLSTLLNSGSNGEGESTPPEVDTELGEAIYGNKAVAFKRVPEVAIEYIDILSTENHFGFTRYSIKEDGSDEGFKLFYYEEGSSTSTPYLPEISIIDPYFEYESLLAKEQNDSFGSIYKLTYLCTAIGTTYFEEKIYAPTAADKSPYGLADSDSPLTITFVYNNDDGTTSKHVIKIGEPLISGSGYYFTVDNRPYVYSTNGSYFNYAFLNCYDYINPILTASGLSGDKSFEPYLTTGFKQWVSTLYDNEGAIVLPGSEVIVKATVWVPKASDYENGGYDVSDSRYESFELSALGKGEFDKNVLSALEYERVGEFESPVWITMPVYSREIDLTEKTSSKYEYEIAVIESVITADGKEIYAEGTPVGENDLIKVTYHYSVDGTRYPDDYHAVIKISDVRKFDSAAADKLQAATVSNFADKRITFEINYDKENSVNREIKTVITEIIAISDSDKKELTEVVDGAEVAYRYTYIVDGVKLEGFDEDVIVIGKEDLDDYDKAIAAALKGKTKGELDKELVVDSYIAYCEIFADFTAYKVEAIKYFVVSENVVSFKFEQASKRNPYYGESLYTNTMEGDYAMYALNSGACEAVLRVFGGLKTNATNSTGLIGKTVIDIGITPEKLYKYGLYAHKIYFEIPRGIENIVYQDMSVSDYLSSLDDYTYYSTLGFTVYISDEDPKTGTRYIASDMYDVIATIDATDFAFLEESFVDFYARRNLVLTNVSNITKVDIEFDFDDLYGSYSNSLFHQTLYAYDGRLWLESQLTKEELALATKYDMINVTVTPDGECIDTEFSKFLKDNNISSATLHEFFDKKTVELDTLGTYNFKEFMGVLFYTHYEGSLSKEEQTSDIAENAKMLAKITVGITGSAVDYVYEFYRIADSRVMVRIYEANVVTGEKANGGRVVSDFYLSLHAFKKVVGSYCEILNKNVIDADEAYPG